MASDPPPSRLRHRDEALGGRGAGRRNVYVSEADVDVWQAAERFARQRGVSLSSVLAEALARLLADPPD